jgi:zinc-finger of transposase IS204/IS1001/IS1096/IS1165
VEREFSAAAVMLGLPGFVVLAVSEVEGELEQAIETTADLVGCPGCGAVAQLHDRRPTWVRDLPAGGRPVTLVWVKRVWRCRHAACAKRTWTETSEAIAPRGVVDPAGPRPDLPPGRPGCGVGGGGGPRLRHWVAHRDDRGLRLGHPAGRGPDPARRGRGDRGGGDRLPGRLGQPLDQFRDRHRRSDPRTRPGPAA